MGKKILRLVAYLLTTALFLFGVTLFVYPLLSGYMSERNTSVYIQSFENVKKSLTKNPNNSSGSDAGAASDKKESSTPLDRLYEEMQQYNEDIYENDQEGLCDAWAYEQSAINLSEFGINSGAVGVLRVPKMSNLEMPIFLGASRNNMAMGATQLGETSMPIGGNNTNCVLAGHRGWSGARYFLDIEQMALGDMVYIENFWETLSYKVTDIQVIHPDDIEKILIQEGRDMVTLITCHPYWASTYRYAVFCERVYEDGSADNPSETNVDDTATDSAIAEESNAAIEMDKTSQTRIFLERVSYVAIPIMLVMLAVVLALVRRNSGRK